jgi:hypothetical protein
LEYIGEYVVGQAGETLPRQIDRGAVRAQPAPAGPRRKQRIEHASTPLPAPFLYAVPLVPFIHQHLFNILGSSVGVVLHCLKCAQSKEKKTLIIRHKKMSLSNAARKLKELNERGSVYKQLTRDEVALLTQSCPRPS